MTCDSYSLSEYKFSSPIVSNISAILVRASSIPILLRALISYTSKSGYSFLNNFKFSSNSGKSHLLAIIISFLLANFLIYVDF